VSDYILPKELPPLPNPHIFADVRDFSGFGKRFDRYILWQLPGFRWTHIGLDDLNSAFSVVKTAVHAFGGSGGSMAIFPG
jgi:hypothetical protein